MTTLKDTIIEANFADQVLTDTDFAVILGGTPASRYALVNKALKKDELIKVRRGLYLLADKYRHQKLSKFFLASRLVPHSYTSLESALSYHGWIPEKITRVTNILATGRTKKFITPFGEFIFFQLPVNEYEFLTGVSRIEEIKGNPFFIASPLRALADYIYIKKIDWQGLEYFTIGLRIDKELLMNIRKTDFHDIKKIYSSKRVLSFLNHLQRELKK